MNCPVSIITKTGFYVTQRPLNYPGPMRVRTPLFQGRKDLLIHDKRLDLVSQHRTCTLKTSSVMKMKTRWVVKVGTPLLRPPGTEGKRGLDVGFVLVP